MENHPDLYLCGYDRRCFEGFHEGGCVADASHRAIVHVTMDKIGKRNDGALLELRYAIGLEESVEVRFDFVEAGYVAVEDVPVGCVCCKRNNDYPTVRTRNRAGVGRLQNQPVPLFFDDCRTAADDGRIGGDEGNVDVPSGSSSPGKPRASKTRS